MRYSATDVTLIEQSGLFDRDWYLSEYPDVALLGLDPIEHYLRVGARLLRNPSRKFDTRFYLDAHPLLSLHDENPLLHYLTVGKHEGSAPLERAADAREIDDRVDIVIPVYNALEHVQACFSSLVESAGGVRQRVLVVNDGSDEGTTTWLRAWCANDDRFELIEHDGNRGYTRAVNTGLRASDAPYVVVLNSDTIVTPGWLTGLLRAVTASPAIGLAGPLSNAASWQNVPELYDDARAFAVNELPVGTSPIDMARVVAEASLRSYPRLPFLNGFCTIIRRAVLDAVGLMDEEAFPVGYGEENDYCIRAAEAGFELVVADDVYVHHAKSQSFGHERRAELTRRGGEALAGKHTREKVRALVERVQQTEALDRIRTRIRGALQQLGTESGVVGLFEMRILFLLPVKGGGGGAHSVVQEASEMRRLGVDALVAVQSHRLPSFLEQYADIPGVRDLFIGYRDDEIGAIADSFDVVVATFFASVTLLAEIASRSAFVLPAYYVQDYEPLFFAEGSDEWKAARSSYTLIPGALLFAKTHWIARRVAAEHALTVRKVEPSIDHTVYRPKRRRVDSVVRVCAMIRPQTRYRGPVRTMRVLKRLAGALPDLVEVHIFGCDRATLSRAGLEQDFLFENHGILTRPGVAEVLQRSDVFVDLSDYQAFGRTALEAMACGCTAVVPCHGGTDEYAVDGLNSIVVDPRDEEDCLRRLVELASSPSALEALRAGGLRTAARYSAHSAAVSELVVMHEALQHHRAVKPEPPRGTLLVMPPRSVDGEPSASAYERLVYAYRTEAVRRHWRVGTVSDAAWPEPSSGHALLTQPGISCFEEDSAAAWLSEWREHGGRLLVDLDEASLALGEGGKRPAGNDAPSAVPSLSAEARWLVQNADGITVSTASLQRAVTREGKRARVIGPHLSSTLWCLPGRGGPGARPEPSAKTSTVRIGLLGTPDRCSDLVVVEDAVRRLERDFGDSVLVEVVGVFHKKTPPFGRAVALPRRRDYPNVVQWLHDRGSWDIAILPVADDEGAWEWAPRLFLEMAALGAAIVCSNAECLRPFAAHEEICLVSENLPEAWYWTLERLARDRALRTKLADAARSRLVERWTVEAAQNEYLATLGRFDALAHSGRQRRRHGRADEAVFTNGLRIESHVAPSSLDAATWSAASRVLVGVRKRLIPRWLKANERANASGNRTVDSGQRAPVPGPQADGVPKVMVGTMHSGEQEFEACRVAIGRQTYPHIEHVVISGLRNVEAHDRLYRVFLESDAELLVKIDADMVIVDERFIERVVDVVQASPGIAILQMAILDFYSGGEIQGVNAYTKEMSWSKDRQDALFTDATETPAAKRKVVWATFARSVVHSPNPAPFQAFHFGVHRGMKVLRALEAGAVGRAREQLMYLERTYEHYETRRTRNLLLACLGAERAFRSADSPAILDYANPELRAAFSPLEATSSTELAATVERLRSESTGVPALDALRTMRATVADRPRLQRVLLLLPHLGTFGGVNRFLEVARHLRRQGFEATVGVRMPSAAELDRVHADFPDIRLSTLEQAHAQRWDAVLCGDYSSGLMTLLPWFDSAMTAIYLLNGRELRYMNEMQVGLAAPDVVLACSSYAAEQCPGLAPVVVAGGVDTQLFCPAPRPAQQAGAPYRVGAPCGRFRGSKRFVDAVAACEQLKARGLAVELHVMNSEPLTVETSVPYVCHVGLRRGEVADYLRSLDVFVCPEEDGGWNNPAAEAMACGVPVVCTRAGTTDFAIDGETALVVPARDVDAFASAIERVLVEPELEARLRTNAVRQMRTFSWAALTRNLVDTLEMARPDRERRAGQNRQARRKIASALKG